MPIKRVIVKIEFCIKREHVALFGHDQRIDLDHRAVAPNERAIQTVEQFRRGLGLRLLERQLFRQFTRLKWLQASQWINCLTDNFLGRLRCNRLDLNPAFRAGHDQW